MNSYQQNGVSGSQRVYQSYGNGGGGVYGGGRGRGRGVYGNLNNPYGLGRGRGGGYNNNNNPYIQQRYAQQRYYEEDDEEKEEYQRLMINLRKIVVPQLDQIIGYILVPMVGAWIFKKLKIKAPTLPSVINISFCRLCKIPIDFWQNPFVKL